VRSEYPDAPDPALYMLSGRDAILDFMSGALIDITTVHHGHMPLIAAHDDKSASGIWAMEDNLFMPDGSRMTGYVHDHESCRRIDGA
jgi:hypothetical protein